MDWSKAKSILIFILASLNIFLLGYILKYKFGENIPSEWISDAKTILADRGVVVECQIPAYNNDTRRLVYRDGELDIKKVASRLIGEAAANVPSGKFSSMKSGSKTLVFESGGAFVFTDDNPTESIGASNRDSEEKALRKVMEDVGLNSSKYKLENVLTSADGSRTYSFTEKFGKFLVFDNRVEFVVCDKGILRFECRYRETRGFSAGPGIKLMPAYKVLLKNFYSGEKCIITAIDIGFKGYGQDEGMAEYFEVPAWRITFKDGSHRYFKASDGEEIR